MIDKHATHQSSHFALLLLIQFHLSAKFTAKFHITQRLNNEIPHFFEVHVFRTSLENKEYYRKIQGTHLFMMMTW